MHGGIIARIARDVLETNIVLDGPLLGDHAVCEYDHFALVDDQLSLTDKNIICGVYFCPTQPAPKGEKLVDGATLELSWWPQDAMWNTQNCFLSMEWTELAEVFYQNRLSRLQGGNLTILGATDWRAFLRKSNTLTKKIEAGVKHYQGGYIESVLVSLQTPYM